jgi:hypothetical protein
MQGGTKPVAMTCRCTPAALVVTQRSPCCPGTYRRPTTQRSINTTAAAHAAMRTGTPAVSASPAPSSAGPIANKSNARIPAIPMKAGLGKSSIDRPSINAAVKVVPWQVICAHERLQRSAPTHLGRAPTSFLEEDRVGCAGTQNILRSCPQARATSRVAISARPSLPASPALTVRGRPKPCRS